MQSEKVTKHDRQKKSKNNDLSILVFVCKLIVVCCQVTRQGFKEWGSPTDWFLDIVFLFSFFFPQKAFVLNYHAIILYIFYDTYVKLT